MKHEVLFLNSKRIYVRVGDTWYDTHSETYPKVGDNFLIGKIEEILEYNSYKERFPESKDEIYPYIVDKTISGGYIRRVVDGAVKYAVNPATPKAVIDLSSEAILN